MSLISEIAQWADDHSPWMSDAVRRLLAEKELSDSDIDDLEALIRTSVGISDLKGRTPRRVSLSALAQNFQTGSSISLTAIREPKNINAIGPNECITFNASGLNVIYGYNGSGKSGYARALKKACRTRHTESIHPNVFAAAVSGRASARFEWDDSGKPFSDSWEDDLEPPAPLSHVAVFDAHCARVFIDEQAAISYIPYGMDIITQLSAALGQVQRRLTDERQRNVFDKSPFAHLLGDTEVGKLLATLNRKTKPEDVHSLAALSKAELDELQQIQQLLQDDLLQKMAKQLRYFNTRLNTLMSELAALSEALGDSPIGALRLSFLQLLAAHKANQQAATAFSEGYLAGTGAEPWELLLRSAIEFAKTSYPDDAFPGPENANCVLCQQPLTTAATQRMKKFFAFLQADSQARYLKFRGDSFALYKPISNARASTFPADKTFLIELEEKLPGIPGQVMNYAQALHGRQKIIVEMASTRVIGELPALPDDPTSFLVTYRDSLQAQILKLEKTMTNEQRVQTTKRVKELGARVKLQSALPAAIAAIKADEMDWFLGEALKCCNTSALTKKHSEMYLKTVTTDLQKALQQELTAFGVPGIKLQLDLAGQRGKQMQQLKLVTANPSLKVKPSGILSEGEQRAIALASFLAEVNLEPGASAIVFDDPITSLDHHRRERTARRLAVEAKKRQVIVFTHDLAFAHELIDSAKKEGHKATVRHVFAALNVKGRCDDKLPFEAQKVPARINELKDACQRAKKALEKDGNYEAYNDIVRSGYRKLRDSWELLVEDHLFAGTLKRFRRPINTLKLRSVRVEDEHAKAVYEGMTRASYFLHEGGTEAPPPLPDLNDFLADIEALESTLKSVDENSTRVEAEREKLGIPS